VISALLFFLPGAFLLGNALAWRIRAERVTGSVIGVRARGKTSYCAVYRYTNAAGRTVDASCNDWSASLADKQTGLTRQLMVLADQPTLVRNASSILLEAGGAAFLIVGFLIARPQGATLVGFDLVLGALLGWYAFKRKVGPGAHPVAPDTAPLQRAEEILATSEAAQRAVRNQRRTGPISIVIGLAMLAVAVGAGRSMSQFETAGVRASGKVLELVLRSAGRHGGSVYHPVVRFTTASGTLVQFEDRVGASPPQYQVGDDVQVLYLANAPPSSAVIDRGIGNWTLPAIFGLAGAALIALGLRQISAARSVELPSQSIPIPIPIPIPLPAESTAAAAESPVQVNVPRGARRTGWLGLCFLVGWSLWVASAITPSPKSATGFGAVMLLFAPALGAFLLFTGQSLAVVVLIVRTLVRAMGPHTRVLDRLLTCGLVMMAGGCVLIAIGLGAQVSHYLQG
jgi:hypothetical protein